MKRLCPFWRHKQLAQGNHRTLASADPNPWSFDRKTSTPPPQADRDIGSQRQHVTATVRRFSHSEVSDKCGPLVWIICYSGGCCCCGWHRVLMASITRILINAPASNNTTQGQKQRNCIYSFGLMKGTDETDASVFIHCICPASLT